MRAIPYSYILFYNTLRYTTFCAILLHRDTHTSHLHQSPAHRCSGSGKPREGTHGYSGSDGDSRGSARSAGSESQGGRHQALSGSQGRAVLRVLPLQVRHLPLSDRFQRCSHLAALHGALGWINPEDPDPTPPAVSSPIPSTCGECQGIGTVPATVATGSRSWAYTNETCTSCHGTGIIKSAA